MVSHDGIKAQENPGTWLLVTSAWYYASRWKERVTALHELWKTVVRKTLGHPKVLMDRAMVVNCPFSLYGRRHRQSKKKILYLFLFLPPSVASSSLPVAVKSLGECLLAWKKKSLDWLRLGWWQWMNIQNRYKVCDNVWRALYYVLIPPGNHSLLKRY